MGQCNCGPHVDADDSPKAELQSEQRRHDDHKVGVMEQVPKMEIDATVAMLIEDSVRGLTLESSSGETLTYVSHRFLEPERRLILALVFPECDRDGKVVSIVAQDSAGGSTREFIASLREDSLGGPPELQLVMGACQILFEDLTPSECVEYSFDEAPQSFIMAQVSKDALEAYRSMKFEAWRKMVTEPSCEAAFKRMLQIGVVTRMYDPHVFPTPEYLKSAYQVIDEKTGKLLALPHPVSKLRIWNAGEGKYDEIDTKLDNAPSDAEQAVWWNNLLNDFKAKQGEEYITSLLRG